MAPLVNPNSVTESPIGALTIGQSPRPDLVAPLLERLPAGYRLLQAGALDGLGAEEIPDGSQGRYPLTTRLRDGRPVTVDQSYLAPRLQEALDQLEEEGAVATILLCAGTFPGLVGQRPLVKPFIIGRELLANLGMERIGLIVPIMEQETPIRERWAAAGFQPTVWTADITRPDDGFFRDLQRNTKRTRLDCIVLDYVGHPAQAVDHLRQAIEIPLLDLGQLAIATLVGIL